MFHKAVKHGTEPFTSKQNEYFKSLTGNPIPPGTNRQAASDLIADYLSKNPGARGKKAAKTTAVPKPAAAKKPAPPVGNKTVYPWPTNPLPAIPAECDALKHRVVPATDEEVKEFVPREPYWSYACDAHAEGRFIQFVGPPGAGKSLTSKALAHVLQVPYIPISCDGKLNPRILFGQINIKNGTSFFTEGEFTIATQMPSVIVLEERNGLDSSVEMTFNRILNNRQFFLPEADGGKGKVYTLHPRCYIIQDCNPPGAKFTGAQKQNVATVDRVQVITVEQLSHQEIMAILNGHTRAGELADFYLEASDVINTNGLRAAVTLRGLKRAAGMLAKGYTDKEAISMGMLNAIELTGGPDARLLVESVAKGKFKF